MYSVKLKALPFIYVALHSFMRKLNLTVISKVGSASAFIIVAPSFLNELEAIVVFVCLCVCLFLLFDVQLVSFIIAS